MQEQKRKMSVGMRCLTGLGKRVILKLQRAVLNIYHDYKEPIPQGERAQKDHTPLREYWGWVEMIWGCHGVGAKLWASCWCLQQAERLSPRHYSRQSILTLNTNRAPGLEANLSTDTESHSEQVMDIHRVAEGWRYNGQANLVIERIVGSDPFR